MEALKERLAQLAQRGGGDARATAATVRVLAPIIADFPSAVEASAALAEVDPLLLTHFDAVTQPGERPKLLPHASAAAREATATTHAAVTGIALSEDYHDDRRVSTPLGNASDIAVITQLYQDSTSGRWRAVQACSNFTCGEWFCTHGTSPKEARDAAAAVGLLKCAACFEAVYCCKACQKEHWRLHKPRCAISRRFHKFAKLVQTDTHVNRVFRRHAQIARERIGKHLILVTFDDVAQLERACNASAWAQWHGDPSKAEQDLPVELTLYTLKELRAKRKQLLNGSPDEAWHDIAINSTKACSATQFAVKLQIETPSMGCLTRVEQVNFMS